MFEQFCVDEAASPFVQRTIDRNNVALKHMFVLETSGSFGMEELYL